MRKTNSPALAMLLATCALSTAALATDARCADPRAHEFDFWIGEWDVTNVEGGKAVGRNRIEPILGGCVLQETWAGVSGSAGTSLNFFDTQLGRWRQFWVWRP